MEGGREREGWKEGGRGREGQTLNSCCEYTMTVFTNLYLMNALNILLAYSTS